MSRLLLVLPFLASCVMTTAPSEPADLRQQVWDTELAFAATMAARDHVAFVSFLDEDAVFFGAQGASRGAEAVAAAWAPLFEGEVAPLSWEPDTVEVAGDLAHSSGPFRDAGGNQLGRFNSIWRRTDGGWRVVFDKADGGE
ncbi:MAG: nuclear transport factor 2 family protein [Planctomycetota bacterium]|nr:nuclear transport factor 2 family protein [Planctomycetota bacterium]